MFKGKEITVLFKFEKLLIKSKYMKNALKALKTHCASFTFSFRSQRFVLKKIVLRFKVKINKNNNGRRESARVSAF